MTSKRQTKLAEVLQYLTEAHYRHVMTDEFSKLTKGNLELEAYLNDEATARDEEAKATLEADLAST